MFMQQAMTTVQAVAQQTKAMLSLMPTQTLHH
jgi:hypothetical protein